jgi:hypothetical protein
MSFRRRVAWDSALLVGSLALGLAAAPSTVQTAGPPCFVALYHPQARSASVGPCGHPVSGRRWEAGAGSRGGSGSERTAPTPSPSCPRAKEDAL